MKKSLFILPLMLLLLTGCNGNNSSSSSSGSTTSSTSTSTSTSTSSSEPETELRIVSQPVSKEIKFGELVTFEVKVNNEDLVKNYQWELLNVESETGIRTWVEIDTPCAFTNKLIIPGPCFTGERPYRCRITDTKDQVIYSDEASYTFTDYHEGVTYCEVGTRIVKEGQTLDLKTTPYGTGTVSINEAGDTLTLNNVNFVNTVFEYDPFDSGVSFYLMNYLYAKDTFTVNLIGENVIYNSYYEPETKSGGIDLGFFFSGRGTSPVVTITGVGSLHLTGGTHCIYSNTDLVVDADLILNGIGDHFNSGIHARDLVINEDVRIFAELSVYLFEANGKDALGKGNIRIKSGAYIDAVISVVQDGTHGSALAQYTVIAASQAIIIESATINLDVVYDYRRLDEGEALPPVEIMATHKDSPITITDSKLNFYVETLSPLTSTLVYSINGIYSDGQLTLTNSSFCMMSVTPRCNRLNAILAKTALICDNSTIDIDLEAQCVTSVSSNGTMEFNESEVNINTNTIDEPGFGIVSKDIIECTKSKFSVHLNSGIALGVYYNNGTEEKGYQEGYTASYLFGFNSDKFVSPTDVTINIYSKPRPSSGYQYYETIYSLSDKTTPLTEFVYF